MGFINQEVLEARQQATSKLMVANPLPVHPGSFNCLPHLGFNDKVLIGIAANLDTHKGVCKEFGLPINTVDALSHGDSSVKSVGKNPELRAKVQEGVARFKEKIQNLASSKLIRTLENITDDKLDSIKSAEKLASVAVNLSKVNTSFAEDMGNKLAVQINLYKPRTREESEYEVIEVRE